MPLFILFCRAEMAVEELFQWGELFKFPVRPLQDGFIGIIQPVTLTFGYGIQSLRIELAVVDGVTFVSMGPVTSMQMKRRLPLGSDSKSF